MLATLDRTDELLVLCGLDVPTLKNVRLALQTLELLSFPSRRIRYVLNRANTKVGLNKREVEAALKVTVHAEVPSDRIVPICGQPRHARGARPSPAPNSRRRSNELANAVMTPAEKQAKPRKRLSLSRS